MFVGTLYIYKRHNVFACVKITHKTQAQQLILFASPSLCICFLEFKCKSTSWACLRSGTFVEGGMLLTGIINGTHTTHTAKATMPEKDEVKNYIETKTIREIYMERIYSTVWEKISSSVSKPLILSFIQHQDHIKCTRKGGIKPQGNECISVYSYTNTGEVVEKSMFVAAPLFACIFLFQSAVDCWIIKRRKIRKSSWGEDCKLFMHWLPNVVCF